MGHHSEVLLSVIDIKYSFYWLIYFHCQYLSAEKFENVVFQAK